MSNTVLWVLVASPFVVSLLAMQILDTLWAEETRKREDKEKATKQKSRPHDDDAVDSAMAGPSATPLSSRKNRTPARVQVANRDANDEEVDIDLSYAVPQAVDLSEFSTREDRRQD